MRVECIACPMAIPGAVKRSARARECLLEVKRLAEPGRTRIARLPKTRRLLLDLQPILGDSTSQSATDEGNPTDPLAMTTPHILGNHEPSGLPHAFPSTTTVFPANYISSASAVDEPLNTFPIGSPVRGANVSEESLDPRAQTLFPLSDHDLGGGSTSIGPTLPDMMPSFPQFVPDSEMAFPLDNSNPLLLDTLHRAAIPDQPAWPSRPGPSHVIAPPSVVAAPKIPDCLQDRRTETNLNEDVVFWLRGLTQRLGYHLVPF
ncbi:uncharacterized protein EI90DRAFT_3038614 [Cantharellus anzutake]|uniref:uncharacterized protein n=1 Tax=Cantharellus anzutake TaxID=1750568 RepID=UPI00190746A0|nr:uncharacterized protein EI90DRAFT_3078932 [Cantharellus anzutake]XP_038921550.1 uncharacterized protein EI90DRAFT_3038614 [Cantharellus anzutake]KAF8321854.1 hypothetical protein EI90DRAFT_3078932 [Cantharellus anzutake]KAF8339959.1 hypothetical protein EI90DRAFT_3038614 [Cantharellus anzutake]